MFQQTRDRIHRANALANNFILDAMESNFRMQDPGPVRSTTDTFQAALPKSRYHNPSAQLNDLAMGVGSRNQKFKGADGKDYGWARLNGEWIPVEWGSVAGTQTGPTAVPRG
jgi:hypothetical protein